MAKIYVSSTFSDLEEHRKEVSLALRRLGHEDIAMEYYVAEDKRPLERCLLDVASSDVYIGIFAFRYGYIPQNNNPDEQSITELEYRKAQESHIPCLIFLLSEDAPWPKIKQDKGVSAEKIESLRQELITSERHMVNFFETADELTRKVNEAVIRWEKDTGVIAKRPPTDWDSYRAAVINRHQWVRLQVIAGAGKDRGPLHIPLVEVFEPQLIAAGASGTDVPDEVRKYQEKIFGPRSQKPEENPTDDAQDQESIADEQEPFLSANPELILDILGRERAQVILGGPGSGKSTILHYAMLVLCRSGAKSDTVALHLQGNSIPFLVDLRNYVLQKDPDFIKYIEKRAQDFYGVTVEPESLASVLQSGHALVFFDGLDEVFDPDERRRVIEQFQTFAKVYPSARLVVTSRIAGYDPTALGLSDFQHYTLLPLTLGQIRHFATQWYQYFTLEGTERTAKGLVLRIVESPRLLDLAGNPLLLTMMAVIYKDKDLPHERWKLYETCAGTLLEDWELKGKGIEVEDFKLNVLIRTKQKSEILERVSMYMLEHGQKDRELNAIAYAPLLDIVANYLEEKYQRSRGDAEAIAVDILRHLMERTYVLAGIGERIFGFVHRTFMEYFAALRCKAQFNARASDYKWLKHEIFGKHWEGGDWEEVLLLLIAMLHDQETQIREVIEYLQTAGRKQVPFNLAFAARCLGEAGAVQDQEHGQKLLAELAQAIATYAPQFRKEDARKFVDAALKSFAALAPLLTAPPEVDEAIRQLNDAGVVASRMAAWQMGFALRSQKERLDYALAALKDNEEIVRRAAIAALEREWPGRADIGPLLADVVRTDRNSKVRHAALTTMQRSWPNESEILDAIAFRAEEETGHRGVIRMIEYLAATWRGNAKARSLVMQLAATTRAKSRYDYDEASVVEAAANALAKSWAGDRQAFTFLEERAINEVNPTARVAILTALAQGWGGDEQALTFLQERVTSEAEPSGRAAILTALAHEWGGDEQALSFIEQRAIKDSNVEVRSAAFRALARGWAGTTQVATFLKDRGLTDEDAGARSTALTELASGWEHDQEVLAFLQEHAANDPIPESRALILEVLVKRWRGDIQVISFLSERATLEPEPGTRARLAKAIAYGVQNLFWESPFGLTQPVPKQLFDILRQCALNDKSPLVRGIAVTALPMDLSWHYFSPFGDSGPLPLLKDLEAILENLAINDPNPKVRLLAFQKIASATRYGAYRQSAEATSSQLGFLREHRGFLEAEAMQGIDRISRAISLWVLAQAFYGDNAVFALLEDRIVHDPDPEIRLSALRALAWSFFNESRALALIEQQAKYDEENAAAIYVLFEELRRGVRSYTPMPEFLNPDSWLAE